MFLSSWCGDRNSYVGSSGPAFRKERGFGPPSILPECTQLKRVLCQRGLHWGTVSGLLPEGSVRLGPRPAVWISAGAQHSGVGGRFLGVWCPNLVHLEPPRNLWSGAWAPRGNHRKVEWIGHCVAPPHGDQLGGGGWDAGPQAWGRESPTSSAK